jgi:hypothetical protein
LVKLKTHGRQFTGSPLETDPCHPVHPPQHRPPGVASILNEKVVVGLHGIVAMFMTGIALAAGLIVASVLMPTRR